MSSGATSALALRAAHPNQLALQAQRYALADYALKVLGLVRPGSESAPGQSDDFSVGEDNITQMKAVVHTRGVKKRLEEDFDLKIGNGENVPDKESEEAFLNRAILHLRREDVKDVIKLFDRVEKNNRKAASNDAAFRAQQKVFRKKVAADDAEEKTEDNERGTLHFGSPESYAEFEDWCQQFEYREGEKDFACFAGRNVIHGDTLKPDDGTFAGYDLVKIQDALHYFKRNSHSSVAETSQDGTLPVLGADAVKIEPVKSIRPDANVIKAELAKWSPAFVVSSYRALSRIMHPDKEGGSPQKFQELTEHAKVLTEACAKFHGITVKKGTAGKNKAGAPFAKNVSKVAICAEFPPQLKIAASFFGLTEESFRFGNPAEVKEARRLLTSEKDERVKQIQRAKESDELRDILQRYPESQDGECEDFGRKSQKQLKTMCMDLCKAHYASLYGHMQKLK